MHWIKCGHSTFNIYHGHSVNTSFVAICFDRSSQPSIISDVVLWEIAKLNLVRQLLGGGARCMVMINTKYLKWVKLLWVYEIDGGDQFADELRKLSWSGIPPPVRTTTWQLLCVSNLYIHVLYCTCKRCTKSPYL